MYKSIILLSISIMVFIGCEKTDPTPAEGGFYVSGIYFGQNLKYQYKNGARDGCMTAQGDYQKQHTLFNHSKSYNDGWFAGRNLCKKLLIVPDEPNSTSPDENVTL